MARKGKKIVESDSEEEAEMTHETQDDVDSDSMDEDDVDDELGLPKELVGVGLKEKRELLQYKQTHNELEWENEMMTRIGLLSKKKDMERLKQMTSVAGAEEEGSSKDKRKRKAPAPVAPAPAPSTKKYAKGRERKRYEEAEDDELEDEEDFQEEEEEEEEGEEGEDSDDLFGEDELEEISKITPSAKKRGATGGKQLRGGKSKKAAPRKRSRLEDYDSDNSEEEEEEDDEGGGGGAQDKNWGEARMLDEQDIRESQGGGRRRQAVPEEADSSPRAVLDDVLKIQSRRVLLEKWQGEPYFADVVIGSFIRYLVGFTPAGVATYRMAEVLDVIAMKPYKLPDAGIMTEKGLLIGIGSKTTEAKMHKVSNSRITQLEFNQYVGVLEKAKEEHLLLRQQGAEKRRERIRRASEHTYTHEEVTAMILKNGMGTAKYTCNFSHAMEGLRRELERARAAEELETMEEVQKEINKLEKEMTLSREAYANKYEKNTTINRRNRERNIQMDMEAGMRKREIELKKTKEERRKDPFARRETRPTILWVTGAQAAVGKEAEAAAAAVAVAAASSVQVALGVEGEGAAVVKQEEEEEEEEDERDSLEEIGKRIQKRFGFNPHLAAGEDKRAKYLQAACGSLPGLMSEQRSAARSGISLAQYLHRVSEQMEQ